MNIKELEKYIGQEIKFSAIRITVGNPVTGILQSFDKTGFKVKLTKDIEGINTVWEEGEVRDFSYELTKDIKLPKQQVASKKQTAAPAKKSASKKPVSKPTTKKSTKKRR